MRTSIVICFLELILEKCRHRKQAGSKKGVDLRLAAIERRAEEEKQAKLALDPKPKPLVPPKRIAVGAVGAKKVEPGSNGKGKQGKQVDRREIILLDESSDEESEDEDAKLFQQAIRASLADRDTTSREGDESSHDEEADEREKARIWGIIKFEKEEEEYLRTDNWEEEIRRCGVDDGEGVGAELRFDRADSSSKGKDKSVAGEF